MHRLHPSAMCSPCYSTACLSFFLAYNICHALIATQPTSTTLSSDRPSATTIHSNNGKPYFIGGSLLISRIWTMQSFPLVSTSMCQTGLRQQTTSPLWKRLAALVFRNQTRRERTIPKQCKWRAYQPLRNQCPLLCNMPT